MLHWNIMLRFVHYSLPSFYFVLNGSHCVSVPSSVEISNKTATAVEGDRLNFTCTASGQPKPNLAWTKVGSTTVITDTPSVSFIVDRPGTADNMIQYQCTASNGVKTPATATVNVTVYCKSRYHFSDFCIGNCRSSGAGSIRLLLQKKIYRSKGKILLNSKSLNDSKKKIKHGKKFQQRW